MEVKKIVEGMTAVEVAEVIDSNFKNQNKILEEDIATQNSVIGVSEYKDFSEAEAVNVGDVRKYNGLLYECVEATTGAFDASKWKKSSFKAETEKKLSELGQEVGEVELKIGSAISIANMNKLSDCYIQADGSTHNTSSWDVYWMKVDDAVSVKCKVGGYLSDENVQIMAFYDGETFGEGFISSVSSLDGIQSYNIEVPKGCKVVAVGNRKSIYLSPSILIRKASSDIAQIKNDIVVNEKAIGLSVLEQMIDLGKLEIEIGAISGSGTNVPNEQRLRITNAIITDRPISVPDGYIIAFVYYYSDWVNQNDFIFERYIEVNRNSLEFDKTYPFARITLKKEDDSKVTLEDFQNNLNLIKPFVDGIKETVSGIYMIEQGGVDLVGVESERLDRTKTSFLNGAFEIVVNEGYKIYYAYYYNKESKSFIRSEEINSNFFASKGEYCIKLVFTKNDVSQNISKYENIVKSFIGGIEERISIIEKELNGSILLEQGGIDTVGVETYRTDRVKTNLITESFNVEVNENYKIYYAYYYNKGNKSFIRSEAVDSKKFSSDGEYYVKLAFTNNDTSIAINPSENIVKKYEGGIKLKLYNSVKMKVGTQDVEPPKPSDASLYFFKDRNGLWSDGIVWREIVGNNIYLNAKGYKTITIKDGVMIGGYNNSEVYELASVTKLMSLVVVCDNITDYNERVKVIESDVTWSTTDYYVQPNDEVTIDSLIAAAVIVSDNTATQALARFVGYKINPIAATDKDAYDSFYNEMNKKAESLGMDNTIYANGAWNFGRSTANDQCLLLKKIQNEYARISEKWGLLNYDMVVYGANARTYSIQSTTPQNARILLPELVGGKTGTSNYMGDFAFVWKNLDDDLYASIVLQSPAVPDLRFKDSRRVIDEVYSLQKS